MEKNKILGKDVHSFILYVTFFLFLVGGFVLSLFNILTVSGFDEVENIALLTYKINGVSLFFGENINLFSISIFVIFVLILLFGILQFKFKKLRGIAGVLLLVEIVLLFLLPILLTYPDPIKDGNPHFTGNIEYSVTFYICITCFIIALLSIIGSEINKDFLTISDITEIAVLLGLALALSYIKIPLGATGGSLNFQIVPLVIIALRHKPSKTFVATGIVYGLLACLLDNYGFFTFPMEYMVAFGSVSIISFFRNYILKNSKASFNGGLLLAFLLILQTIIRLFAASIDSYLFYLNYLDDSTFVAAIIYNVIYVIPTGVITLIAMLLLYIQPIFVLNNLVKSNDLLIAKEENNTKKEKLKSVISEELHDYFNKSK